MTAETRIGENDPAWREIENALTEIVSLSKSDIPFGELSAELLQRSVRMLAAKAGAVWLLDADGTLQLSTQLNFRNLDFAAEADFHQRLLRQVLREGKTKVTSLESLPDESVVHHSDSLLIIRPLIVGEESVGLFELIQRPTTNAARLRGNERLVSIVADVAADHLERTQLREIRRAEVRSGQFERFAHQIHQSLDLKRAAYELANEGRLYIGCDRVTVLVRYRRGPRVVAVSGVDDLNRRANLVRDLERLATRTAASGEAVWYDGDLDDLPPQIVDQVEAFLDQSRAQMIAVVPMIDHTSTTPCEVGVLIAESFERLTDSTRHQRVQSVASQGALSIKNALSYRNLPTLPFARRVGGRTVSQSRLGGLLVTLAVGLVLMVALATVPASFEIAVRGKLQPLQRLDVFAPQDGTVIDVRVDHNDVVEDDQLLVVLESSEIDLQLETARGERDTTQKRLMAVESALLQFNPGDDGSQLGGERLAADREELKLQLAGQQRQFDMLRTQQADLQIRSPINGRVLTWDVRRRLADRPVQRGQSLMTVADLAGGWIAELQIPDDRMGFVLEAQQHHQKPLSVTFELSTNPGEVHSGELERIANRVEFSDDQTPAVLATMDFDDSTLGKLRPGATVLARIHCGRKPLGYVWLHDLIRTVREWILL